MWLLYRSLINELFYSLTLIVKTVQQLISNWIKEIIIIIYVKMTHMSILCKLRCYSKILSETESKFDISKINKLNLDIRYQ